MRLLEVVVRLLEVVVRLLEVVVRLARLLALALAPHAPNARNRLQSIAEISQYRT